MAKVKQNIALFEKKNSTKKSTGTKSSASKKSSKSSAKKKSTKSKSSASKKSNKSASKSKAKPRISLDPLRQQLKVLTDRANKMVDDLIEANLPSRALFEAQRTFKRMSSRQKDDSLFKSELKDRRSINREFARVQTFLTDYTSTLEGAQNFDTDLRDLKGAFKEYRDSGGDFENIRLKEQNLDDVFDVYRRVIEAAGGWERAVGIFQGKESLIGFGSEVLINNIYDMVDNGMAKGDIISIALDMIDDARLDYEKMANQQIGNYDYGIIFDDEETTARRNYFEQKWQRRNSQAYRERRNTWE